MLVYEPSANVGDSRELYEYRFKLFSFADGSFNIAASSTTTLFAVTEAKGIIANIDLVIVNSTTQTTVPFPVLEVDGVETEYGTGTGYVGYGGREQFLTATATGSLSISNPIRVRNSFSIKMRNNVAAVRSPLIRLLINFHY